MVRPSAGRVSAAVTSLRSSGPTPAPGPSATALRRSSASSASKAGRPAKGATITAVRCAALTATESGGLAIETIPAPARSAARAASRAAPVACAGPDRTSAAPRAYLCERGPSRGRAWRQRIGELTKAFGAMRGRTLAGMPMSARRIVSAERPARLEQVAGLQPEEGDARGRLDRCAADVSASPVEARGNVDRDDGDAPAGDGVDGFDDRPRLAVDVAREPRAEDGVDDSVRPGKVDVRGGPRVAGESGGCDRGVAVQRFAPSEKAEFDRKTPLRQEARRDKAVAAIVAGPAKDSDPAPRPDDPRRLVRDRAARGLHQRDSRDSPRDRHAVGLAHLGGGQEFREVHGIAHAGKVARPMAGGKR